MLHLDVSECLVSSLDSGIGRVVEEGLDKVTRGNFLELLYESISCLSVLLLCPVHSNLQAVDELVVHGLDHEVLEVVLDAKVLPIELQVCSLFLILLIPCFQLNFCVYELLLRHLLVLSGHSQVLLLLSILLSSLV